MFLNFFHDWTKIKSKRQKFERSKTPNSLKKSFSTKLFISLLKKKKPKKIHFQGLLKKYRKAKNKEKQLQIKRKQKTTLLSSQN